ncbi:MAG TPA: discoidin domain-containing protein [Acidimicrobiales bacterium]|nr:discoidin domain-containing protein [Acidimicrobiales bacterium]
MRRRKVLAGLLAAALALGGSCSSPERTSAPPVGGPEDPGAPTTLPPRADAALRGRVVDVEGRPRAGVPITVVRTDTGIRLDDALAGLFTLGLACVADAVTCGGEDVVDHATTDADGRYELTLPGAYLAGYETDEDWIASVGLPAAPGQAAGPVSTYELEVSAAVQDAPDLVLWDVVPEVRDARGQLTIAVPPLPPRDGQIVDVQLLQDGRPLWEGSTVDRRVLEDASVVVTATGRVDVPVQHPEGRTVFQQVVRAASVGYRGDVVPPSRGAPCTVAGATVLGCPFTDGALLDDVELSPAGAVSVDLGPTRDVGEVVVRGSRTTDLEVDVSSDGEAWTSLAVGPLGGAPGVVARSSERNVARYVRVASPSGIALSEISVWPVVRLPDRGGDGSSGTDQTLPVAVAVTLLALVTAGLVLRGRLIRR